MKSLKSHTKKVYRCIKDIRKAGGGNKAVTMTCKKYKIKESNIRKIAGFKYEN